MCISLIKSRDETHSKKRSTCSVGQIGSHKGVDLNNKINSFFRPASALYSVSTANVSVCLVINVCKEASAGQEKKHTEEKQRESLLLVSENIFSDVCCSCLLYSGFFFCLWVAVLQRPHLPPFHKPEVMKWNGRLPLLGEVIKWFHR